jgi:hypothetical protein
VLAWRLSNTLTADFCLHAVREAITRSGKPEIFNTDQGCQFTSQEFTGLLEDHGIQISMDGDAIHFINRIVEASERLEKTPLLGRVVPEFAKNDLRELPFRGYDLCTC